MITPDYVRTMARYNRWQNESLYGAAGTLSDAQRKENRGAFFGSIHATLSHLMFGDGIWMSRFTANDSFKPRAGGRPGGVDAYPEWETLKAARVALDERILSWANTVSDADLDGDLTWFSGLAKTERTKPRGLLIAHMFNHQTHHRGQAHCLLTSFGAKPDDTDLMLLPA